MSSTLADEVELIHTTLEKRGANSRRVQAIDGSTFDVPVDADHKATVLKLTSIANPHMRAFYASTFAFFSTFFSTFAPAPLAKTLQKPQTLSLTRTDLYIGNMMSVTSNIICRFLMGIVCDKIGARRGLAFVMLVTTPFIIGLALVTGPVGFIICRFFIGMGLASFVACQVWCTQQFSKSVVGMANATAGGWGNLGGGVTTLLMPQIFLLFMAATNNDENLASCLMSLALRSASSRVWLVRAATRARSSRMRSSSRRRYDRTSALCTWASPSLVSPRF